MQTTSVPHGIRRRSHWATCLNRQEWQQTGVTERDQAHARCLAVGEGGVEALVSLMLDEATPEEAGKTSEHAAHCAVIHRQSRSPNAGRPARTVVENAHRGRNLQNTTARQKQQNAQARPGPEFPGR